MTLKADDPKPPAGVEKSVPDPSDTALKPKDKAINVKPDDPLVQAKADKGTADATTDTPDAKKDKDIVLNPTDPRPPKDDKKKDDVKKDDIKKDDNKGKDDVKVITDGGKHETVDGQVVTELARYKYYIQLGSYADKAVALAMQKKFGDTYPIVIYAPGSTKLTMYKVMIGPLNKAESDTMLYRFQALGYKDAFVKYNN